ncbi:MAG: FecR domain-containing protein [Candidatus Eisenbacteria bacterium]|uniref:FecR domain-containing protein n=1 Tax=Eiseniibacteriota bacterium TaxID=2212470 RepID=A0A9D6L5T7_UNCEI|nr:FecR domain-containing protein [Candidatus Eisenbacteria bacterium]MBI3539161.1 FecR domain-containing protein [Candidatus Eisenbacteria bacterium]
MSADRFETLTPDERRARDAVRALEAPRAEPSFRARLKQDFVSGRIGERRALVLARPWWRSAWALAPAATAVAAAIVIILNRGPEWTVMSARGDGIAIVDDVPVPMAHMSEEARRLRPGARVRVPEGASLDLAAAGTLMMEIAPGSDVILPATPRRWFGRAVAARVGSGIARFTTGPSFHGARLAVATPEAGVEVTGTTLAVICEPAGTCVCVFEGVVRVTARGGSSEMVGAGRRRFVFRDGRAPESAEMRPTERTRLGNIHDHRAEWLGGGR